MRRRLLVSHENLNSQDGLQKPRQSSHRLQAQVSQAIRVNSNPRE
jgi:hypothetical protein